MEFLNISIYLLVLFGSAVLRSTAEENRRTFNCEATVFSPKLNSTIECVDRISYSNGKYEAKCFHYSNNSSMRIYWTPPLLTKISSHTLTCTSGAPLSTEIYFRDGEPRIDCINIRHERVKFQSCPPTQEYIMTLLLPDIKELKRNGEDIAVKYKIFNKEDPQTAINVLFTYYISKSDPCLLYRLGENVDILLNREIITIPCLSMETKDTINLFRRKANLTANTEELKVDNHSVSYDPMEGFKINTTLLTQSEGNYICNCNHEYGDRENKGPILYSIRKLKTQESQTETIYVYHPEHNFDVITGSRKLSFDLECVNHLKNVTIEGEHTSTLYRVHSKSKQISEFPFNITIKHYKDGISSPYYFAYAKVPYLNTCERTALKIVEENDKGEYTKHESSLRCSTDGNITLHNWNIIWVNGKLNEDDSVRPLLYKNQRFHCTSNDDDLELRQFECETPTECRVFLKCLETKEVEGERQPKVDCDKEMVITKRFPCQSQKISHGSRNHYCAKAKPFKSGIVQCLSRSFNVVQPYFQGFDNKLHVTSEPPLDAIIKLSILSTKNDLYTKGQQILLCEAHQFFHEHGIQWDFKNSNGTSILPDERNSDYRYPRSTIKVSFAEVTEVVIVCLAPLLYKREWRKTKTILKLKKSLPPEFHSNDTDVYFDVSKKHQSMTCHPNGFPQPQIHWIRNNETVEDESIIVDSGFKKVLLFPTYNESLSGEYICQASNIAGNKSLRFQVFTVAVPVVTTSSDGLISQSNILISSGFCLMILLLLVFFAIYLRYEKVKKHREIRTIIGLLNGNSESTDNPLELPFNTKLELEKNSFSIDKGMLLGKGEFGEVYKGRIEGVDGFIAFKTLSENCSISHIKALVSEIKMLMYVGEHPNLVELIGVYRKELRQGILCMGLEFCDLGSLESYLRTYKHLFMKCPIINSYINTEIVQREGKEVGESRSIHSMKTLIKWCYQIANAMEYLGTKNVVHSDLATRNVLLTAEANAKVTDFGLSRRTYNYTEYVKTAKDALPWRWLALECLLTNTFSSKSDVWAFGITLWEIFSFGEMPYPGMTPTIDFVEQLKNGLRNNKPNYASQELYHVMCECWHPDAHKRPSFSALRIIFESAVTRNEANIDLKISKNCNLEEIAKEILGVL